MRKTYTILIAILIVFLIASASLIVYFSGLYVDQINTIFSSGLGNKHPLWRSFAINLSAFIVLTFLHIFFALLNSVLFNRLIPLNVAHLRNQLAQQLSQSEDFSLFENGKEDRYRNLYLKQISIIIERRYMQAKHAFYFGLYSLSLLILMFVLNWTIALIVLGLFFIPLILQIAFQKLIAKQYQLLSKSTQHFSSANDQYLKLFETTFRYSKNNFLLKLLDANALRYRKQLFKTNLKIIPVVTASTVISVINQIVLYLIIGVFFFSSFDYVPKVNIATLITFSGAAATFFGILPVFLEGLNSFLASQSLSKDYALQKETERLALHEQFQKITLKDVSFSDGEKQIFNKFNFTFTQGQKYLIKGASGTGKSILLKMVLGIVKPQEGQVFINEKPLQNLKQSDYHKLVHFLDHNPLVLDWTLGKNLFLKESSQIDLKALSDLVAFESQDLKLDSELNSATLSSGEKQKIALMRFFANPKRPLLIIDEALSNVDTKSRETILAKITKQKELTLIYVSHDPQLQKGVYFNEILSLA